MGRDRQRRGEVIALSEYRTLPELPELSLVRTYWDRLRGPRVAPLRGEVDPRGIAAALPYAFILDRIAPGQARFRLAGMHVCDLMGMELRGMPFSALFRLPSREPLSALLGEVFDGPHQLTLAVHADRGMGRPALDGQMLLLPLADHHGVINRALGCLVMSGGIGHPPRRLELRECQRRPISGLSPRQTEPPVGRAAEAGLAEPSAAFRPRPALHVISNDD
jgi:hypothetical protein